MEYDPKYDAMPLRGKTSVCDAMIREYSQYRWAYDWSRAAGRKYHRHRNTAEQYWWKSDVIGLNYRWYHVPSKGQRPKTWKDYKYGPER